MLIVFFCGCAAAGSCEICQTMYFVAFYEYVDGACGHENNVKGSWEPAQAWNNLCSGYFIVHNTHAHVSINFGNRWSCFGRMVTWCIFLPVLRRGRPVLARKEQKNLRKSNERPGPAQNKIVRSCKRARVHTHTNFGVCMSSTTKVSFLPILPYTFTVQTRSRPYQKIKSRGFNLPLQFWKSGPLVFTIVFSSISSLRR